MSLAAYELLQRHPQLLDNTLIIGNGAELPPEWQQQVQQSGSHILTWDWQTFQQYTMLDEDHKHFAMPQNQIQALQPKQIILLWPKAKTQALNLIELIASQTQVESIYAVAANDAGGKSIGKACSELASHSDKIDSARRCSLWQLTLIPQAPMNWLKKAESFAHQQQNYLTLPGVFCHGKLDVGTRILLEHLPAPAHGKVLDLGCGSGVIGLSLKQQQPALELTLADVDAFALRSAELNAMRMGIKADVIASDGLHDIDGRFDFIISNPPFHQGKDTDYRFAQSLFQQAKQHLVTDGQLWIVANRHLSYEEWGQQYFASCEVLAQQEGFKIICLSHAK